MGTKGLSVLLRGLTGGGKRDRTADLLHAMQALSQLSYTPNREREIIATHCKGVNTFRTKNAARPIRRAPCRKARARDRAKASAPYRRRRHAAGWQAWAFSTHAT